MPRRPPIAAVLGDPQVLIEVASTPARRVVVGREAGIEGVAAYEPLFGSGAEAVIAVRDPRRTDLVGDLLRRLMEALRTDERTSVLFRIEDDQMCLADAIWGTTLEARLTGRALTLPVTR